MPPNTPKPLNVLDVVPTIVKQGALYCAVLGSVTDQEGASPMIVFKSLDRQNVVNFIEHSWKGTSQYDIPY